MTRPLLVLTLLALVFGVIADARAERIDGPANIRAAPNGEVIASLRDGAPVEIEGRTGDWFLVRVLFYVRPDSATPFPIRVKAKTTFYKRGGRPIGRALRRIAVESGPDPDDGRAELTFTAYTYKNNIVSETLAERALEKLVRGEHLLDPRSSGWRDYLRANDFGPWFDERGFTTYILYINDYYDPSPGPRLLLFFHKNRLVAALHDRALDLGQGARTERVGGYSMTFVGGTAPAIVERLKDTYYERIRNAD